MCFGGYGTHSKIVQQDIPIYKYRKKYYEFIPGRNTLLLS